jgi:acetyl esterase
VLATATLATVRTIPRLPDDLKRLLLGRRSVTVDGNTLDVTLQLWLAALRAAGIRGLVISEDVAIARSKLRAAASALDVDIAVASVTDLSIPGPAGPITARHYRPTKAAGAPVLVFYHGGGFVVGDLDTHDSVCRRMCRDADIHVLSVDYRLAPEYKAPAAVEDAYAAYRWALDHVGELGADPGRVAVGGDSAGGNLAAVVAQQARDDAVQLPALQLLIYPVTNRSGETRSMRLFGEGYFLRKWDMDFSGDKYLSGAAIERTDPRVSPLLADDLSGLPPALVLTAGFDPLRDEGNQYAAAMRAAGTSVDLREYRSLIHAFVNFFSMGGGSATATTEMISALRAHLSHA